MHAIALQGGVSVQLARIYPGLFDAVLVIACVAAITLRDARWWARGWAWLVVIVMLAAIGTADVLHAADYALRHRTTEAVMAAAPVVTVLLAGVRPDFARGLHNLRFSDWLPADRVFHEENKDYSATLKAVRHVYALLRRGETTPESAEEKRELYYLV